MNGPDLAPDEPAIRCLTDEQRDLVMSIHPLAMRFAKQAVNAFHLRWEDAQTIAEDALLAAAAKWEQGRAKFSTFGGNAVKWRLHHAGKELARNGRAGRFAVNLVDNEDGWSAWEQAAVCSENREAEADARDAALAMLRHATERERRLLIAYYLDGCSLCEIGEAEGRTRECIRQVLAAGLDRIRLHAYDPEDGVDLKRIGPGE